MRTPRPYVRGTSIGRIIMGATGSAALVLNHDVVILCVVALPTAALLLSLLVLPAVWSRRAHRRVAALQTIRLLCTLAGRPEPYDEETTGHRTRQYRNTPRTASGNRRKPRPEQNGR